MASDVFGFHVSRVCRVRSADAIEKDVNPWTAEAFRVGDEKLATEADQLCKGALAFPHVVTAAGAMVVLGEPGSGKTSVLRSLIKELPPVVDEWDQVIDACLWVSGGDLTNDTYREELGRHLEALPPDGGSDTRRDAGVLWVVLDQTDESELRLHLPMRLKRSLRGRDTSRARFLMACRTADYPVTLTPVLSEAFGACWCVDLAPLSRKEAVVLADSADVPGEELVAAAEAVGATVLASVPLTLELLVLTYRADNRLHGTPQDLFARGVEHLVQDPDPHRLREPVLTTAPQRLMIAGRIAAWTLLSGHRTVWRGHAFEAGAFDLPGDKLSGGKERTVAGPYEVTPQALEETLATALFTVPDDKRVAFRHSSVAAYLAARYLTDRKSTQRQLENLFLVGSPDGDTASIPTPLRETATWLVAMNPTATEWLATADPESLAVHSALVRSDKIRHLTVNKLLERAVQVELSDTRWQLSHWDLRHPQLADQLTDVLESAPSEGPTAWETTARIRLAIQLAQEAGTAHPRLACALLRLVENNAWHHTERRLAADAAFACDADSSVPVFYRVLTSLDDPSYAEQVDPDHDLRGTVLTLLWPDQLDVATMLAALRPPSPHSYNSYAHFLRTMPTKCPNEYLPDLLVWAQETALQSEPPGGGFVFSPDRIETPLIDSMIDRVLDAQDAERHLGALAKIILSLLREHHEVCFPDSLQPDAQGEETLRVQSLRRLLAHALVKEAVDVGIHPREAAWTIVHDWQYSPSLRWAMLSTNEPVFRGQLVDEADFAWALEQTVQANASGDTRFVAAYGELAARLFPTNDPDSFDLAYDEGHPAWPYLASFYAPVDLDSQLARALRRSHRARHNLWPDAEAFISEQGRCLDRGRKGDTDSLWRFLWDLRVDVRTGRYEHCSGAISTWPGAISLNDELTDLPELALHYLVTDHDYADSWIHNAQRNKRAWAGYVFLVELHRADRLTGLPSRVWHSWAAAILTGYVGMSTSYMEPERQDLLRLAAVHAPQTLARRITELAQAALAEGRQPIELNPVDPRWATELCTTMEHLAKELSITLGIMLRTTDGARLDVPTGEDGLFNLAGSDEARQAALRTWHSLLSSLLAVGSETAHSIIDAAFNEYPGTPLAMQASALAAQALLITDAEANWPRVKELAKTNVDFGRCLAEACVRTESNQLIQSTLNEDSLTELYLWLSVLYAPEEDEPLLGVRWVSPEEEARRWRDGLLSEMSRRATVKAVHQLRQLAARYPDRLAIASALLAATKQHAAASWSQVRADDVIQVLQDPARRVIRTSTDLLDVVQETLEAIGEELPSHGELLWDRTPGKRSRKKSAATTAEEVVPDVWRPKPEAALCAYLKHELSLRLASHRVAVNREVLIYATDPYGAGDRTDILIDALPAPSDDSDTGSREPVKLVIEVKGAWNPGVRTAQDEQLAGRYLPQMAADAGIYLVGWYPIELWDASQDKRKTQARKLEPDTLLTELQDQSVRLSQQGSVHIRPMVVTIPRPHKN